MAAAADAPPRWHAHVALLAYCVHNGWNCWVFLNFTNAQPAVEALHVDNASVSAITAVGWLGILAAVPLVPLCPAGHQRRLLVVAGLLNALSPVLRYYGARRGNFPLVLCTNVLQGGAFGILAAWPPVLAVAQWPERRHALITAVASLSNYVGGAAGTIAMPLLAPDAAGLLRTLRLQACAAPGLCALVLCWAVLPPVGSSLVGAGLPLRDQLRACARPAAARQISSLGLVVGVSLALQGLNQALLAGMGFTDVEAGLGNTVYQLAAAATGTCLGACVRSPRQLARVLRGLHQLALAGLAGLAGLAAALRLHGRLPDGPMLLLLLLLMAILGAALMGIVPFCLAAVVRSA